MVADAQLSDKAREKVLGQTSNVVSFCYHSGLDCTILGSKSGGKFRIQSSNLETMLLVTADFVSRLAVHYGEAESGGGGGVGGERDRPLQVAYTEPLPLADFFEAAEVHFTARQNLIVAVADLDNRAHQFRSIQKRLLVRCVLAAVVVLVVAVAVAVAVAVVVLLPWGCGTDHRPATTTTMTPQQQQQPHPHACLGRQV
jgi:hypothetical protein